MRGLKLIIVHNHFRPGGVRRVIELALPHLLDASQRKVDDVLLVGGEAPDTIWLQRLRASLGGVRVACAIEPALGYVSEQRAGRATLARRIGRFVEGWLGAGTADGVVVWAHNQGLGRNLLLTEALGCACASRGVPLVFHQHDWWFDNRWARWAEMRRMGYRTLGDVAKVLFPREQIVRHALINRADAAVLQRHLGERAVWLPNLAEAPARPAPARVRRARLWLRDVLGDDAPVWLVPCRLLRRKNLAEALLLTRWLRPEAWLVTTGGVSSADEQAHAHALAAGAVKHGWKLKLGVMAGDESAKPAVSELLAASEAILLTSLQEGFGLPNLEAAAAGRPLIVRTLPNIAPDLAAFGFRFPQAYDDVRVDPELFDCRAEVRRQERRWRAWRAQLPRGCRPLAGLPPLLAAGGSAPVPFSRLTLTAQLEVLTRDPQESWEKCAPLNSFLKRWRDSASRRALKVSHWPRSADRWLSGRAYAKGFSRLLEPAAGADPATNAGESIAQEFIRAKLAGSNQYPLLWTSAP